MTLICDELGRFTVSVNRAEKSSFGMELLGEPEPQASLIAESQPTTAGAPARVRLAK